MSNSAPNADPAGTPKLSEVEQPPAEASTPAGAQGDASTAGAAPAPARRPRRARGRGRSVAELARRIGQEVVDSSADAGPDGTLSHMEKAVRKFWSQAEDGDVKSFRCLIDYAEGRPAQTVTVKNENGVASLSADELARVLAAAAAKVEAWRQAASGK